MKLKRFTIWPFTGNSLPALAEERLGLDVLRILFRQEGAWLLGLKVAKTHGLCWAVASLFMQFRGPLTLFSHFR